VRRASLGNAPQGLASQSQTKTAGLLIEAGRRRIVATFNMEAAMATSTFCIAFLSIASLVTFAADAVAYALTAPIVFVVNVVIDAVEMAFPRRVDPWDRPVDVVAIRALDRDKPRKAFLERAREHSAYQGGGFMYSFRNKALLA